MKNKTQIWQYPWQFTESFIILSVAVIMAFLFDFIAYSGLAQIQLSFPENIYVLISFISVVVIVYFTFKKTEIIKWLRSEQLAISSIIWLLILVILMGFINQDANNNSTLINKLNLNNIVFSKAFIIVLLSMSVNLLMVVLYRLHNLNIRNILFVINHLGILILIISLTLGVGDIQKYTTRIDKDNYIWQVSNSTTKTELPFALRLIDFDITMFPAKIGIVENKTDKIIKGNNNIISSNKDSLIIFKDYKISLVEYIPNAIFFNKKYHFVNDQGSAPAAKVSVEKNGIPKKAWISCGSFIYPSEFYEIDSNYTLVMLEPEPKLFKSDVEITYKNSKKERFTIKVNKPINIMGWDIYQTDYDKEMGKWSNYSVVEIVKDPWLNFVYLGIFMMIIGASGLIILGKKN